MWSVSQSRGSPPLAGQPADVTREREAQNRPQTATTERAPAADDRAHRGMTERQVGRAADARRTQDSSVSTVAKSRSRAIWPAVVTS